MADSKLSGLSATTTPLSTDIFYIVTDPGGTPTSNKVTGANMGKALGFGTNVLTFLTTPTSANLIAAVTNETGTGALTFATLPTFTTGITISEPGSTGDGAILDLYLNKASPAANDRLGEFHFYGNNSSAVKKQMAAMYAESTVITAGAEVGKLMFNVTRAGAIYPMLYLDGNTNEFMLNPDSATASFNYRHGGSSKFLIDNTDGVQVRTTVSTGDLGVSNVRFGLNSNLPTIHLNHSGGNRWLLDNNAGQFRFVYNASTTPVLVSSSGDLTITGNLISSGTADTSFIGDLGVGIATPSGLEIRRVVATSAIGADNVRLGMNFTVPTIILEHNTGGAQWSIDNLSGVLRFILNALSVPVEIASTGLTTTGNLTAAKLINAGAANTSFWTGTGYSITGSGTTAMVNLAGTLNTSGVTNVILSSITNTAAGAGSNHLNFKTGGTSVFAVRLDGSVDISNIAAGSPNIIITKTSDTPTTTFNVVGTANASAAPSGFIEITEGGTSKYIPFYA